MINKKIEFDKLPTTQTHKSLVHGENIIISKDNQSISPEYGFEYLDSIVDPSGNKYDVIGRINTINEVVLMLVSTLYSEIGIFNGSDYIPKVRSRVGVNQSFAFRKQNLISGEYYYNVKNELIVAFSDGNKDTSFSPFLINLDNIGIDLNSNLELVNPEDVELLKMFPKQSTPNFNILEVLSGGNLEEGAYYFTITYLSNSDLDHIHWFPLSNPTSIADVQKQEIKDSETYTKIGIYAKQKNEYPNKSIKLEIKDLDIRFNKFKLATVHIKKGITTAKEVGIYNISGDSKTIVVNGSFKQDLSIDELIIPKVKFNKVEDWTKQQNRLLGLNVEYEKYDIKYQKYANNIKTEWYPNNIRNKDRNLDADYNDKIVFPDSKSNTIDVETTIDRTFMPFDVYALYISFNLKVGGQTVAYHIPGREVPKDIAPLPDNWRDLDYATDLNYIDFEGNTSTRRDLGLWYNQDEKYPDNDEYDGSVDYDGNPITNGKNLKNLNVRHHRMPGISKLNNEDVAITTQSFNDIGFDNIIGIKLTNIYIPDEIIDKVDSYTIYFAKRDTSNHIVIDTGFLGLQPTHSDDSEADPVGSALPSTTHGYIYTIHSPSLMLTKPILSNTKFNFAALYNVYDNTFSLYDDPSNKYKVYAVYKGGKNLSVQYITDWEIYTNKIENVKYTPSYNTAHKPQLIFPKSIYTKLKEHLIYIANYTGIYYNNNTYDVNGFILLMYITNDIKNCYLSFTQQELVSTGINFKIPNNISGISVNCEITGRGDSFLNNNISNFVSDNGKNSSGNLIMALRTLVACYYSSNNLSYRELNDNNTLRTNEIEFYFQTDRQLADNYYEYDITFSKLNDITVPEPFDINNEDIENSPYRVVMGLPYDKESKRISWRIFNAMEYYDMPNSKGEGISIHSAGSMVFIQMNNALFVTGIKDKIKLRDMQEAYLGQADIFDRKPNEIMDNDGGYIKSHRNFKNASIVKLGKYFTVDPYNGKMFLITPESINEITIENKEYFKFYFTDNTQKLYNPYFLFGGLAAYDFDNDRYLITLIDKEYLPDDSILDNSKTISYYPQEEGFLSFHKYNPDFYFNIGIDLYNIKNNDDNAKIFKNNSRNNICIFHNSNEQNPTPYDAKLYVLFNIAQSETGNISPNSTKILDSLYIDYDVIRLDNSQKFDFSDLSYIVYNDTQCTDIITLEENIDWFNDSYTIRHNTIYINNILDKVKDNTLPIIDSKFLPTNNVDKNLQNWFKFSNFISKFNIVGIIINNKKQHIIYIKDINLIWGLNNIQ